MKNMKKLFVGLFAMSALMLGACSGSEVTSSSSAAPASSSTAPATTSQAPTTSSEAEVSSSEEENSSEEASSSEGQASTEHTVALDSAPTAGRVIVVHAWDLSGGVADVTAQVDGLNVTFNFGDDDFDGYLIAELKEGKTFSDFSQFDENDPPKIVNDWNVVERQTENVTSMTATAASWTTKLVTITYDTTFTTQFGSDRVVYLNSWKNESSTGAGDGAAKLDKVVGGKALLLKNADAYELVVLKAGKTELITGETGNWDEVVDAESVKESTLPTTSIKAYYSASLVVPVNDGGEIATHSHTVTIDDAPATTHKVFVHGWKGSVTNTVEATFSGAAITFDLGTDNLDGYIIVELKDGKTTYPGKTDTWSEFVLRQSKNITDITATTAKWATPKPADTTPYVAVARGGNYDDMDYFTMIDNPEKVGTEVMVTNVALAAGDVIYVRAYITSSSNDWLHYSALESGGAYANFETEGKGDNNIKTKTAGNYDFYVTVSKVYIAEHVSA